MKWTYDQRSCNRNLRYYKLNPKKGVKNLFIWNVEVFWSLIRSGELFGIFSTEEYIVRVSFSRI